MALKMNEPLAVREAPASYQVMLDALRVRPGYKQTEVGVIPQEWNEKALHEGVKLLSGHHVLAQHCNTEGKGTPYITGPADFPDGIIGSSKFTDKPTTICRKDDILVTVKGSGAGTIVLADSEYCISRQLMAVRVAEWDKGYVHECLRRDASLFGAAATGLIPGLSRGDILNKRIPIPPLPEQRAIAASLSDVDALLAAQDKLIAKKRDIKQAAMQQLLTGKQRLPGFAGEWGVKRLGELASISRGASPRPIDSPIWFDENSTIGWVRISDVTKSEMFLRDTTQRLSPLGIKNSRPVNRGGLIMSICATVGKPIITEIDTCIHDGFVVFGAPYVNQRFLFYVLKLIERDWGKHGQTGSQMNLNTGLINRTEVSIPKEEDEQRAIAAVLSDMDADITALEQQRDKTRALKQGMMQELLTGRIRLV